MTMQPSKTPQHQLVEFLKRFVAGNFDQCALESLQILESAWKFRQGPPAIHTYGQAYAGEEKDSYRWRGLDSAGRPMWGKVKYDDPQTIDEIQLESVERQSSTTPAEAKSGSEIARSRAAATDERIAALSEWMAMDDESASEFIVDELCRADLTEEWRDALVYAAENVHFRDAEQQVGVRLRLRELALELREVSRPGVERVVWSAMRRFSSLLSPEKANDLLEFLDRKGVVDTRMVALQCVARVFQDRPPWDTATLEALERRVAEYAEKFLDPDVFGGGENSSIARNAVLALASLGSPRLRDCVVCVNALGRRWLSRQIRRQLQALLDTWKSRDPECKGSSAFNVVEEALKTVQTNEAG